MGRDPRKWEWSFRRREDYGKAYHKVERGGHPRPQREGERRGGPNVRKTWKEIDGETRERRAQG